MGDLGNWNEEFQLPWRFDVRLDPPAGESEVVMVSVLSDWHVKRPVLIEIFDDNGTSLGGATYPMPIRVCGGEDGMERLHYPRVATSQLFAALDTPAIMRAEAQLHIVVDGLLCGANGFVIIQEVRVLGRRLGETSQHP